MSGWLKDEVRERLLMVTGDFIRRRALKYGKFILASGVESSYYLDLKLVSMTQEFSFNISHLIWDTLMRNGWVSSFEDVEAIGCPATGAIPLMQSLITHLPKLTLPPREREGFYVREKPKDHGITDLIAGNVMPGLKTLMVEDVTTSGASFLRAISAAEAAGCNIVGAITVVERAGNAKNLLSARYKFAHVFDIIEIL